MAETRICLHVRPEEEEEEEIETLSVTSFSPQTGALQEERKTELKKIGKNCHESRRMTQNWKQTKPTQRNQKEEDPGASLTQPVARKKV